MLILMEGMFTSCTLHLDWDKTWLRRSYTFWRFLIEIPLAEHEMQIRYSINNGIELNFFVPGRNQTMRLAAYSVRPTFRVLAYLLLNRTAPSAMVSALASTRMTSVDQASRLGMTQCGRISFPSTKSVRSMY